MIKKILIADDECVVSAAVSSGIENVMVDLETIDKQERQKLVDAHFTTHTMESVDKVSKLTKGTDTKLLVRCNPLGKHSKEEIESIIAKGADIIMLPMFRNYDEVRRFKSIVNDRVPVVLLVETRDALLNLKEISTLLNSNDRIHFGLNDLSLELGFSFLFDVLDAQLLDGVCNFCVENNIEFGIGGVGSPLSESIVSPKYILSEHMRLKSSWVILSRAFRVNFVMEEGFNDKLFSEAINKLDELTVK